MWWRFAYFQINLEGSLYVLGVTVIKQTASDLRKSLAEVTTLAVDFKNKLSKRHGERDEKMSIAIFSNALPINIHDIQASGLR